MEELVLNNRRVKLIDGEICVWKPNKKNPYWRKVTYSVNDNGYYYIRLNHNYIEKGYYIHRIIYKFNNPDWDIHDSSSNNQIDHIDNDKSNNNIENLRVVNSSENKQNTISTKGYYWNKGAKKYRAKIMINNKKHYLGCYDTEEEAREAYLNAKEIYHTH
tara:strand:+ start:306 stop:785 length:480 start_codon:yes stop_codon:yes gene_type:complete